MEGSTSDGPNEESSPSQGPVKEIAADCQWGRYNVHYVETEGERTSGVADAKRPLRSKVSSEERLKRQVSDAGLRQSRGAKSRNRVSRRQSEGPVGPAASARSRIQSNSASQLNNSQSRLGSTNSCLEPCLRLSIIRHESDLRKKRVAFSDAPAVVWNDPPVVLFSPVSGVATLSQPTIHHHHHHGTHRRHSYPSNSVDSCDGAKEEDGQEEVLTPKEKRRRKVVMAVVCTTFILLTASALFVLITLFNASAIDEAGISLYIPVVSGHLSYLRVWPLFIYIYLFSRHSCRHNTSSTCLIFASLPMMTSFFFHAVLVSQKRRPHLLIIELEDAV